MSHFLFLAISLLIPPLGCPFCSKSIAPQNNNSIYTIMNHHCMINSLFLSHLRHKYFMYVYVFMIKTMQPHFFINQFCYSLYIPLYLSLDFPSHVLLLLRLFNLFPFLHGYIPFKDVKPCPSLSNDKYCYPAFLCKI